MSNSDNFHVPRYEEFPDIELYMDQVITYLNKQLLVFSKDEADAVTPSMINNYVKNGIVPPPNGKKYNRRHLAYMTAVFFLKQTLKMDELKQIISYHVNSSDERRAYETFCSEIEEALASMLPKTDFEELDADEAGVLSLKYAALGIVGKMYAQKVAGIMESADKQKNSKSKEKYQTDK